MDLLSDPSDRRVAISAFVGDGAEAFLPFPKGIKLVCWPNPTGTNPRAVRVLLRKGVDVRFSDSLHMKVYWSKHRGAIITSANLSTNALGAGGLKEVGVKLLPGELDIERILSSLRMLDLPRHRLRKHSSPSDTSKVEVPFGGCALRWPVEPSL
jgi:hypothetical protein